MRNVQVKLNRLLGFVPIIAEVRELPEKEDFYVKLDSVVDHYCQRETLVTSEFNSVSDGERQAMTTVLPLSSLVLEIQTDLTW